MAEIRYCGCPYCDAIFRLPEEKFKHRAGIVRCGACKEIFDSGVNLVTKTDAGFAYISDGDVSQSDFAGPAGGGTRQTDRPDDDRKDANADESAQPPSEDIYYSIDIPPRDFRGSEKITHSFRVDNASEDVETDVGPDFSSTGPRDDSAGSGEKETGSPYSETQKIPADSRVEDRPALSFVEIEETDRPSVKRDFKPGRAVQADSDSGYKDKEKGMPAPAGRSIFEDTTLGRMNRNGVDRYVNKKSSFLETFTWTVIAGCFVILLSMQIKYFYIDKYAQNAEYRKYLAGFCGMTGCELPPLRDPYKFTLTHTKIDLHPTRPGVLRVTVKMVNEAGFAQPHPSLELTLTDRVGRVVGRRTFSPDSYLEDVSKNMVGDGKLATVLFDLARPHEKAVGFKVNIVTDLDS